MSPRNLPADIETFAIGSLESKRIRGLFFAGEILDVDGPCGGFNLQWAFSSGLLAAQNLSS